MASSRIQAVCIGDGRELSRQLINMIMVRGVYKRGQKAWLESLAGMR